MTAVADERQVWRLEKRWMSSDGAPCAIIANHELGFRCGYTAVGPAHPWHGLSCSAPFRNPRTGDTWDTEHELHIDSLLSAHGGLTYSGTDLLALPDEDKTGDLWWFGFDCNHYSDGHDPELLDEALASVSRSYLLQRSGTTRSRKYVQREVEQLAAQLRLVARVLA